MTHFTDPDRHESDNHVTGSITRNLTSLITNEAGMLQSFITVVLESRPTEEEATNNTLLSKSTGSEPGCKDNAAVTNGIPPKVHFRLRTVDKWGVRSP